MKKKDFVMTAAVTTAFISILFIVIYVLYCALKGSHVDRSTIEYSLSAMATAVTFFGIMSIKPGPEEHSRLKKHFIFPLAATSQLCMGIDIVYCALRGKDITGTNMSFLYCCMVVCSMTMSVLIFTTKSKESITNTEEQSEPKRELPNLA